MVDTTTKKWAILNLFGLAIMLTVNFLSNALPLNGYTAGELSDLLPNLFVPAGLTFSIWGVIYVVLILFVIHPFRKDVDTAYLGKIGPIFFINTVLNAGWLLAWHYLQVGLSVLIMLILLGTLIWLHWTLEIGRKPVSRQERIFIQAPISIYFGWISVATIANISAYLPTLGWNRFGLSEVFWAVAVLVIATILGLLTILLRKDVAYGLVLVWSFLGIALKRLDPVVGSAPEVGIVAIIGLSVLVVGIILNGLRSKK